METVLLHHHGIDLPCFAAFPLVDTEAGRDALRAYYARSSISLATAARPSSSTPRRGGPTRTGVRGSDTTPMRSQT